MKGLFSLIQHFLFIDSYKSTNKFEVYLYSKIVFFMETL